MRCPACGNENREGARFCDSCGAVLAAAEAAPDRAPEAGAPLDAPATVGEGRYRIREFIGEGARKRVYVAEDARAGGEVAVSIFEVAGIATAVQARARREAQAMGKLGEHPHLVRVLDSGEEAGSPFIVSEYMPGGDVAALLDGAEGRRLDVERATALAADVCRALEHAHSCGIVHRDLKPGNVWLGEDGRARLGDFGLATEGRARVSEGTVVGTVAYLPPEQALGDAADHRSDLYSLGALLYEMLAGQPPFPGDDAVAIISQHLHTEPVPPSRFNPGVSRPLDELVLALLAKDPDDRPGGAAEVRELLAEAAKAPPAAEEVADDGEENPLDRLAGGVFVGRDRELDDLRGAVDGALAGRGRLVLLVGEPGIGKTRTAEEVATYARVRGARVHWGRCREEEGAPAYWPWVQAIRSFAREADPVGLAWQLGAGADDVAALVPDVAGRLGRDPDPSRLEGEEARFRIFDSVMSFLTAAGHDRPLLIVLDDLHWADEPSLLLLKFAASELAGTGLLILGTYRDVELGRHHALSRVLGELGGEDAAHRVALRGLDAEAIARYIEMTSGSAPPPGLAEAVHQQTEGNPFFLGEVVRLLVSEGRLAEAAPGGSWELAIPQGVRDVVGKRLDLLSASANEALTVAAACGREFDAELVRRASELPADEIEAAGAEAVAARLVEGADGNSERFRFSHALIRETLYGELSATRRVALHGRIGAALEEAHGADAPSGELAHHFLEAAPGGDAERAIAYATRAAGEAMERLAWEEAADLYERAMQTLELGEPDRERRRDLLLALGGARLRAGRFTAAREALHGAVAEARELGDAESIARAALRFSEMGEAGTADEDLIALLRESLAAIGEGPSALRASLLSALGQELYWLDSQGESRQAVEEAAAIARQVGDSAALAGTLQRLIFVPFGPEGPRERLAIADEMLELGRGSGDRELEQFARQAEELRMPHHLWHVPAVRAMRAIVDGELEEAERLSGEALATGRRAEQPLATQFFGIQQILLRRLRGGAEELLPVVKEMAERFPGIPAWRTAIATVAVAAGDEETARTELERLVADDCAAIPRDANYLVGLANAAESCAAIGDRERAEQLYELLRPYEGLALIVGRGAVCFGPVSRVLGMLARLLGRLEEAEAHLERAVELATRMGDRPWLAETRIELAALLLERDRRGDRDRALELLAEALGAAREMGARATADRALALRLEAQGLAGVDVTTSIDDVISAVESERPDLSAHAAPDGKVTIVFSDIEDSTVLTERLGDERWLEELRAHNEIFRDRVTRHGGVEVKNQGDGFMLAFPDAREALECAIDVQRDFAGRAGEEGAEPLRIRMGAHTGEAIAEEGDFFGKNVILAARIAAQADGEEILVSSSLREEVGEAAGFDDGRELELKGLAGRHRVYRAEWEPQTAAA